MLDFKIRSRLIVSEKDVAAYYEQHPVIEPAAYLIERAVVPFTAMARKEDLENALKNISADVERTLDIVWSKSFWITKGELADNKQFVTELKVGQTSGPVELPEGFELFRMKQIKPEKTATLEEQYREIFNVLRKPLYDKLMEEYKKQLFDAASIIYF
jgi:hypothetical protein